MGQRLELQTRLEGILGSPNVYFQPPPSLKMLYPCITYHYDYADTKFADNVAYRYTRRYMVTVIDRDPDSLIPDKVAKQLAMCTFNRFFTSDNLNHTILNVFF